MYPKWRPEAGRITTGLRELGAPSDEYINSPWREGSPRVLKELTPPRGLIILVTRRPELSAIFELDQL